MGHLLLGGARCWPSPYCWCVVRTSRGTKWCWVTGSDVAAGVTGVMVFLVLLGGGGDGNEGIDSVSIMVLLECVTPRF